MNTAFGPQGANAVTSMPPSAKNRYGTADTWFRDCSSPTANDATVMDAQFLNNLLGNIRYAVRASGIALSDGNMTMLYDAIVKIAQEQASPLITSVDDAFTVSSGTLKSTLGTSSRSTLSAVGPERDLVPVFAKSLGAEAQVTPYGLVKSVLEFNGGSVTYNPDTGKITLVLTVDSATTAAEGIVRFATQEELAAGAPGVAIDAAALSSMLSHVTPSVVDGGTF